MRKSTHCHDNKCVLFMAMATKKDILDSFAYEFELSRFWCKETHKRCVSVGKNAKKVRDFRLCIYYGNLKITYSIS